MKKSYRKEIRIDGKRYTQRFSRSADAERWYLEKKREKELQESGLKLSSELLETSLADYAEAWMKKRINQGKPYSSWSTDQDRLQKWILPKFGTRILQRVTSREYESFLDELVTDVGLSPATRNRVRAVLHKLYSDAKRDELLAVNPISRISVFKEPKITFDYWHSLEECQAYLAEAEQESSLFYVFAMLALNTGARIGELLALTNADVDLSRRRIHLSKIKEYRSGKICHRTKGGGDRWLGINDEVFEVLTEQRNKTRFGKPQDFVIHTLDGSSLAAGTIRQIHRRLCKKAGLKEIRIHDLRHTFASHFIMNHGSLTELQAMLGHSSPAMTLRYAHMAPGHLESRARVVQIGKAKPTAAVLRLIK